MGCVMMGDEKRGEGDQGGKSGEAVDLADARAGLPRPETGRGL